MKRRNQSGDDVNEEINSYVVMGLVKNDNCVPTWIQTNNIKTELLFRYIKGNNNDMGNKNMGNNDMDNNDMGINDMDKYDNLIDLYLLNSRFTNYTILLQFLKKYNAFFNNINNYNIIIENLEKLSKIEELIYNNYLATYGHIPIKYSDEKYESEVLDTEQQNNLEIYNNYYNYAMEHFKLDDESFDIITDRHIQNLSELDFENNLSTIIEKDNFLLINYLNDVLTNLNLSEFVNSGITVYQLIDNNLQEIKTY